MGRAWETTTIWISANSPETVLPATHLTSPARLANSQSRMRRQRRLEHGPGEFKPTTRLCRPNASGVDAPTATASSRYTRRSPPTPIPWVWQDERGQWP